MKIEDIIYDILEIKSAANDDSDIDELWLLQKINSYRAAFIQESYLHSGEINLSWVQRYPVFDFQKVCSGDDPSISHGSITLGKYTLPPIISLPFDLGLYQVFGASRAKPLTSSDFATMLYRVSIKEDLPTNSGFVSRIGNDMYVYPYVMKGQAHIIAANPFDVPVYEDGSQRKMKESDFYPMDPAMAQSIILAIVTKDLQILEESVPDIINDSQSQLKILKTDGPYQRQQKQAE